MTEAVHDWVAGRESDLIELLSDMIAIDSVTGNEGPMAEFCHDWLKAQGVDALLQPAKDRNNVIGVVGEGPDTLWISGHLDTVPPAEGRWTHGPFTPKLTDGRVWGLGASDMHASIAGSYMAQVYLLEKGYSLPGRYMTGFTIEEETTGDGTRLLLDWAEQTSFLDFSRTACVVTEPTGLKEICLGNRGSVFLVITVKGLGGHGSRPHLARNPLTQVMRILEGFAELEREWAQRHLDADFGTTTLTPTCVQSGDLEGTNVIPEVARVVIDCRPVPAVYADDLLVFRRDVKRLLSRCDEPDFEITWQELYPREGHMLEAAHPLARTVLGVVRDDLGIEADFAVNAAGNDAVFIGQRGIPTINKVGPGHPELAHRIDEHVTIENLLAGAELFIWLALRHFSLDPR